MKINLNIYGAVVFILLSVLPLNAQLNKLQSEIAESKKKAGTSSKRRRQAGEGNFRRQKRSFTAD